MVVRKIFAWWPVVLFLSVLIVSGEPVGAADAPTGGNAKSEVPAEYLSSEEADQVLARIRTSYRRPEAFKGNFTQITSFADTQDRVLSSGRLWLQGPDKMRWEYQLPEKQLLTSDGDNIWYYNPDLNQVMTGKVKDIKEARVIVNLLSEIRKTDDSYRIRVARQASEVSVYLLPAFGNGSPPFESLKLLFRSGDLRLKQSLMTDLFANRITINYNWLSGPDPALPKAHFVFSPPANCDVVPLN